MTNCYGDCCGSRSCISLLLAVLIFAAYGVLAPARQSTGRKRSSSPPAKIEQMAAIFARTWQRPPTAEELKGLIDDYVKEEIYVREALAPGPRHRTTR